jgi:hypothetical protein
LPSAVVPETAAEAVKNPEQVAPQAGEVAILPVPAAPTTKPSLPEKVAEDDFCLKVSGKIRLKIHLFLDLFCRLSDSQTSTMFSPFAAGPWVKPPGAGYWRHWMKMLFPVTFPKQ